MDVDAIKDSVQTFQADIDRNYLIASWELAQSAAKASAGAWRRGAALGESLILHLIVFLLSANRKFCVRIMIKAEEQQS